MPADYPEHEKLRAIRDQSQKAGEFLEWLQAEKGVSLMVGDFPLQTTTTRLLAEFFEIDLDKIEDEKRTMLEVLRRNHESA